MKLFYVATTLHVGEYEIGLTRLVCAQDGAQAEAEATTYFCDYGPEPVAEDDGWPVFFDGGMFAIEEPEIEELGDANDNAVLQRAISRFLV